MVCYLNYRALTVKFDSNGNSLNLVCPTIIIHGGFKGNKAELSPQYYYYKGCSCTFGSESSITYIKGTVSNTEIKSHILCTELAIQRLRIL